MDRPDLCMTMDAEDLAKVQPSIAQQIVSWPEPFVLLFFEGRPHMASFHGLIAYTMYSPIKHLHNSVGLFLIYEAQ